MTNTNSNTFGLLSNLITEYNNIAARYSRNGEWGDMEGRMMVTEKYEEALASSPLDTNSSIDQILESAVMFTATNNKSVLTFAFDPLSYIPFSQTEKFEARLHELGITEYAVD